MNLRAMLYVKEMDRMAAFYGAALGLSPMVSGGLWVQFDGGFALHAIPPHIAAGIVIASPPQPREETPIKLIFAVDDLDAASARLEAMGAPVARRPWGACDCVDPEGNVFQLAQA